MNEPCIDLVIQVALYDLTVHLLGSSRFFDHPHLLHPDDLTSLANHPKRQLVQKLTRYHRRKVLAAAIEQPELALCFSHTEFGKPVLESHPQLSFNQSHSQSMYALAWSHDIQQIGVDVEDKNRVMRVEALAKHALTALEYERFQQAANQQLFWLKLWTIKEAVLKASGLGIRLNLNELETHCLDMQQANGVVTHPQIGAWSYACYELPDHMLCVSWPSRMAQQNVKIIFSEIS